MERKTRSLCYLFFSVLMVGTLLFSACGGKKDSADVPGEEITPAPGDEITQTPGEEITDVPGEEITQVPGDEITQVPGEEITQVPGDEITQTPGEEITQAPGEEITQVPGEEITPAPGEEITPAPGEEEMVEPGMENPEEKNSLDVLKQLDYSSVIQDGEYTSFNVITETGEVICFQGKNISIDKGKISMEPGAYLVSLNYIGEIREYRISADSQDSSINYGVAVADASHVGSMKELQIAMAWGVPAEQDVSLHVPVEKNGFVALHWNRYESTPLCLTKIEIFYDETVEQTLLSELDPDGELCQLLALYPMVWEDQAIVEVPPEGGLLPGEEGGLFPGEEGGLFLGERFPWQAEDVLDVLAGIVPESVVQEDNFTNFSVKDEQGRELRFQGIGITVSENKLILEPGAKLLSLDYMGCIKGVRMVTDVESAVISLGAGYANQTSVKKMTQLKVAFSYTLPPYKEAETSLETITPGFFGVEVNKHQPQTVCVEELLVAYDAHAEHIPYEELSPESEDMWILSNYGVDWTDEKQLRAGMSSYAETQLKLKDAGTIKSDIIAGIDHASVVVEGDITFFNSVMSDGTVVRFEGKHIDITPEGITIYPDSTVVSLDAVGKIFAYSGSIQGDWEGSYDNTLDYGYGYTYSAEKTSVERADQVHTYGISGRYLWEWGPENWLEAAACAPNFVYFSGRIYNTGSFVVTGLNIAYNPEEKVTAMTDVELYMGLSTAYMEGERYDAGRESLADADQKSFDFYLLLKPDTLSARLGAEDCIWFVPNTFYRVGELRDASGNVLDKENAIVEAGTTLEITVGDYELSMELPVVERYKSAQTMHDLVPYAFPDALGENNTLVIPVAWADQQDKATEETLDLYRKTIGRVMDEAGNITDYSDYADEEFSLSEYFDIASYGKLTVNSFLTDWYYSDKNFAEIEHNSPDKAYVDEVLSWVKERYPKMDWSRFDQDANGYVDSIVIINAGTSTQEDVYSIISYGGAIHYRESYYGDYAGTPDNPNAHTFVTINDRFLRQEGADTLIHEFSHNFGIIDYYDVTYSGINAVGGFDMQSDNKGDWNAYSKLAVGWMNPQVVAGLDSGESKEFTIASSALAEDVLLIPAAGTTYTGPFGEYIMIDLLTDDGVNEYDTAEYGLSNVAGVRISHVNAAMEKRTMEIESKTHPGSIEIYDIGTIHTANSYSANGKGQYNIEVIQAGKENTFTVVGSSDVKLSADDLFYAGDVFTLEKYSDFFYEGLMDDGSVLGYTITIVSIDKDANGIPTATIRVTAQ